MYFIPRIKITHVREIMDCVVDGARRVRVKKKRRG